MVLVLCCCSCSRGPCARPCAGLQRVEANAALDRRTADVQGREVALTRQVAALAEREAAVDARESLLRSRGAALEQREAVVAQAEQVLPPPPSSSPPPLFPLCNVVLCHLLAHHALAGVPCSRPSPLHCFSAFGWGAPLALSQAAAAALNRSTHSEAKSSRTRRDRADAAAAATAAAQTDVALHVAAAEERLQAQRVALERREREVSAREERAASALAEVEHKRRQVLEAEGVRGVVVVLSSGSCWV